MNDSRKSQGGTLRYKCRMCSEEFDGPRQPDLRRAIEAIMMGQPNPWPEGGIWPGLIEMHLHKDGYGVADLVGGVIDNPDGTRDPSI